MEERLREETADGYLAPEWARRAIFDAPADSPAVRYRVFLGQLPDPAPKDLEYLGTLGFSEESDCELDRLLETGGSAAPEWITVAEALGIDFDESDPWCQANRHWLLPEGSDSVREGRPLPPDLVLRAPEVVRAELLAAAETCELCV